MFTIDGPSYFSFELSIVKLVLHMYKEHNTSVSVSYFPPQLLS